MIPEDKQYWGDYAKISQDEIFEAVQLTQPAVINGKQFESGDWSLRIKGKKDGYAYVLYSGLTGRQFEEQGFRRLDPTELKRTPVSEFEILCERIDDLTVTIAKLAGAMERYGIVNDPSQK